MPNEVDHLLANTINGIDRVELSTLESDDSDQGSGSSSNSDRIKGTFRHIRDAWQDTLDETQDPQVFMSMGLTKSSSILPSKPEVVQAVEEVEEALSAVPGTPRQGLNLVPDSVRTPQISSKTANIVYAITSKRVPLQAYVTLGSAVCALSSIGPFLAAQKNVSPCMKIVWRFQGTALLLSPFFLRSLYNDGMPRLTIVQWMTFIAAAASYAVLCVAFAISVNYISVADATILTNSQSILLVAVKLCSGQSVLFLEILGVLVAFSGGILCAKESADDASSPSSGWLSVWGDALGIISSLGGIGYIVLGKSLRAHMPVILFMVLNMLTASFIILFYMWCIGDPFSWDRHIGHGVFGYFHTSQFDRLPLELMTVVICNVMGTMGYVRAFAHFSSVIIAVAALAEPVVASFTAFAMNVGVLPGMEGWIGNFLVAAGTLAVLWPTVHLVEDDAQGHTDTSIGNDNMTRKTSHKHSIRTPKTPRMASPGIQARRSRTLHHCESIDESKAFYGMRGSVSERV